MNTLKSCPFCGSDEVEIKEDSVERGLEFAFVVCRRCQCYGPIANNVTSAANAWNSRRILSKVDLIELKAHCDRIRRQCETIPEWNHDTATVPVEDTKEDEKLVELLIKLTTDKP